MSKCVIKYIPSSGDGTIESVTFEGATVGEAQAMLAEFLIQTVGASGEQKASAEEPATPTAPKASAFLDRVKGGN